MFASRDASPSERRGLARSQHLAFTLIELLIVLSIISILAAIAVPNYQDALIRSKCAKFMGDCKAVETAIEAYNADNGKYPPEDRYPVGSYNRGWNDNPPYPATGFISRTLTTPVAYLGKLPMDPFPNHNPAYPPADFPERRPYNYSNDMMNVQIYTGSSNQYYVSWVYETAINQDAPRNTSERPNAAVWMICSSGPDGDRDHGWDRQWVQNSNQEVVDSPTSSYPVIYDPSNGTLSDGDLLMFGPGIGFIGS